MFSSWSYCSERWTHISRPALFCEIMDLNFNILLLDVDLSYDLKFFKLIWRTVAVSTGNESGGRRYQSFDFWREDSQWVTRWPRDKYDEADINLIVLRSLYNCHLQGKSLYLDKYSREYLDWFDLTTVSSWGWRLQPRFCLDPISLNLCRRWLCVHSSMCDSH